ncbi:adenosylcobinamide kinase [Ruminococcus sp. AF18-22]|nr:adenosylcobinamide kinase [Ruminococcus sp. AF18-22]
MFYVLTGGSGSGKSEYAESLIQRLSQEDPKGKLYYFATMVPFGEETQEKIKRHKRVRAGKGFSTIECYTGLKEAAESLKKEQKEKPCVLLECMSNLAANELYMEEGAKQYAVREILEGIEILKKWCRHLVVVTNEIFSEAEQYTKEMQTYKKVLGEINCHMTRQADHAAEIVYGIPVCIKGTLPEREEQRKETEQMKLIIGGAFQGKRAAAEELYPDLAWCDGRTCSRDDMYTCQGIFHFETYIRRLLKEDPALDPEIFTDSIVKRNPTLVVVSGEIGCGLVPVDGFDRLYREKTGRICTCIAKRAASVIRVVCGQKIVLKQEKGAEKCR